MAAHLLPGQHNRSGRGARHLGFGFYRSAGATALAAHGCELQLRHVHDLVERADLDTVTVQVLPLNRGAHVGMDGAFTILGFHEPDEPGMLYVEYPSGSMHMEKVEQVRAARLVHEHLRSAALDPGESVALIERVTRRL